MNKNFLIIFCAVGFLLVALVAALLIGSAGGRSSAPQPVATTGTAGETGSSGHSTDDGGETDTGETQQIGQTNETGEAPSFQVEFGVGDEAAFATTAETRDDQANQSTSTQPTQGRDTAGTLDAANGENGMPDKLLTYEEFLALSNEDQQAYFFLFADPLDYALWLRQAQQDYEEGKTSVVVTGPVDLDDIVP